ncbi:MAG: hypothetical protein UT11_C0045G0010 [Berkelbacteria bacterium GW2011_GWA2_38_9]|uniref:GIY-YIG domain-containing protein n=1 Tax=Berkelbacteria bacterium GW2011_GWA2_38_9 TaxID=1618334 RepID=A0A0G0NPR1_9BACT|nr:MAG: hypothetical protein UT11_C0045G0010 [Berkelbacteria bacterium GW2011_GWA2_38_9]
MFYVYILLSKRDDYLYIGYTNNLIRRFKMHNEGKVLSTRLRRPFKLIYYEAYLAKNDAILREKFFKTGWGRNYIQRNLKETLIEAKI